MDTTVIRTTLSLIGPGVLLVFSAAFVGAWLIERKRPYLLLIAGACAAFTLGAVSQILRLPSDLGLNALASGALHTAAVLLVVEGILLRSGRAWGWRVNAALLVGFVGLLWYFFYVDRNVLARVYIQNFGYGLVLLAAALRLTALARGRVIDRILFWMLLLFALHFFPRTLLTIGFATPVGLQAFANAAFWQALQLSLAVLGTGLALSVLAAAIADILDDLRRERDSDGLTGLLNRRGFEERLSPLLHGREAPASLILCDVDHFKTVNDRYGHDVGDTVLRKVGAVLGSTARKRDLAGRIGGEEFVIFLPDTHLHDAYDCAERLRAAIAATSFAVPGGEAQVTASFGVAQAKPGDTWQDLYQRADARLYQAKRTGRNRTVAAGTDKMPQTPQTPGRP